MINRNMQMSENGNTKKIGNGIADEGSKGNVDDHDCVHDFVDSSSNDSDNDISVLVIMIMAMSSVK